MFKMTDSAALPLVKAPTQVNEAGEEDFKPLTREEAQKLREASPALRPLWVVAGQLVAGVLVACAAWGLTGRAGAGWSALYGSLAVVVPGALFARGLAGKMLSMNPGTAVAGFFLWEMVKIALTVVMLFAAPKLVVPLDWLALLAGFVVTMKVYWAAVWLGLVRKKSIKVDLKN